MGILDRSDATGRSREGLLPRVEIVHGDVPEPVIAEVAGLAVELELDGDLWPPVFLEHQESYDLVRQLAGGLEVLDAFAGPGGFSLSAAAGEAVSVAAVESSEAALAILRANASRNHLAGLVDENGWRCVGAPELGKFRGPGRKADPCPIANVYALKALAQVPELVESPAARRGAEMLLWHWEHRTERKIYMFGIGTTYRRLKYPFVWYDILHVVDVLSRFPFVRDDARFREMLGTIVSQADDDGRYWPTSMYRAWTGWAFADKKRPSPWLTLVVLGIQRRLGILTN